MAGKKIELGPSGRILAAKITAVRMDQNLTYTQLSERLGHCGRPISALAVRRIEEGERRVDVDDLIALAVALGVSPNTLLAPHRTNDDDETASEKFIEVTGSEPVTLEDYWHFLDGMRPIGARNLGRLDAYDFVTRSLPPYLSLINRRRTITSSLDIPFIHRETETDGLNVKWRFSTDQNSMFRKDDDD